MYESAKFIHGRPFPLPGHNLMHLGAFCHFMPGDGSWKEQQHNRNAMVNMNRNTKNVRYEKEPKYYPSPAFEKQAFAPADNQKERHNLEQQQKADAKAEAEADSNQCTHNNCDSNNKNEL